LKAKWPIEHLTHDSSSSALFTLDGDMLVPRFHVPEELGDMFDDLVAELVEWRLADYLTGNSAPGSG
jgi:hypothetical protein